HRGWRISIALVTCLEGSGRAPLLHADQIDVENQRGAGRDVAAGAACAIAQVRRNDQRAFAADMHGGEAFVPALDDLALAEREGKRLATVERAVEFLTLLAVDEQPSGVIDGHGLAGFRHRSGAGLDVDDAQAARRGDLTRGQGRQWRYGERQEDCRHEETPEVHVRPPEPNERNSTAGHRRPPMTPETSIIWPVRREGARP